MNTLIYFTPDPNDACSFYRGIGPLSKLDSWTVKQLPDRIGWYHMMGGQVGFMLRPYHDKHIEIAKMITAQMPLWLDFDDDLFSVPPENLAFTTYTNPKTQETIAKICGMAQVITVTTERLREVYSQFNQNVLVIPNAYDDYLLPTIPPSSQTKTVLWRGSDTHFKDLLDYSHPIKELIKEFHEWDFKFVGAVPWMIADTVDVTHVQGLPMFQYFQFLRETAPSYIIVPLSDTIFNKAKSNIAAMEGAMAGARPVVPYWPEWKIPGVIHYSSPNDFYTYLAEALSNPLDAGLQSQTIRWVKDHRLLSDINQARAQILEDLLS